MSHVIVTLLLKEKENSFPWTREKLSYSQNNGSTEEGGKKSVLQTGNRVEVFAVIMCLCRWPVWKELETIS